MKRLTLWLLILLVASVATSAWGDSFQASGTVGAQGILQATATLSGLSILSVENQAAQGSGLSCLQGSPCSLSGDAGGWYPESLIYIDGVQNPTASVWVSWTASYTFPVESSAEDLSFVVPMTTASFEVANGMSILGTIPGTGTLTLTGYTSGNGWDRFTSIGFAAGSPTPVPTPEPTSLLLLGTFLAGAGRMLSKRRSATKA